MQHSNTDSCILLKFYIKPQLSTFALGFPPRCILSKFYIKPQLRQGLFSAYKGCILSKFYIKPQLSTFALGFPPRCILSKFYIKPQHGEGGIADITVVSYRNSTSNHNARIASRISSMLYLIEILHQTTTFCKSS